MAFFLNNFYGNFLEWYSAAAYGWFLLTPDQDITLTLTLYFQRKRFSLRALYGIHCFARFSSTLAAGGV